MKRCVLTGIISAVVSAALVYVLFAYAEYEDSKHNANYLEDFYGSEVYGELDVPCSTEDLKELLPVLDFAEEAFSHIGEDERFGELSRYCARADSASESHTICFITAALDGDSGYMWVMYSKSCFDENGETLSGTGSATSRWELKRTNGEWTVTDIWEHP